MEDKSILIIGGGIAGLAAGVYGQMNGYRTTIFEMHTLPGGLCTSWQRKGYVFDGCIHWLVGTNPQYATYGMWQELGALKNVEIVNHGEFTCIENTDGRVFHMYSDVDKLEKHMLELAPVDEKVIKEFCGAIRSMGGFDLPIDGPKNPLEAVKGAFGMLPVGPIFLKYGKMSTQKFAEKFKDPFMKTVWGTMFDMPDFPMIGLLSTLAWQNKKDAGYPIGGSLPFAKSIEKRYRDLGGEMYYGARVERILVENDKAVGVELTDGRKFRGGRVISAADGFATVNKMLGGRYRAPLLDEYFRKSEIFEPLVMVFWA